MTDSSGAPSPKFDLRAATESPCATCPTTPCCTHVGLTDFTLDTLKEVDHARYLLNFERIRLGIKRDGTWLVQYRFPCQFLTQAGCSVHDEDLQPSVCRNYSPYSCWYKAAMTDEADFLRVDRRRMDFIASRVTFDEFRTVISRPDWDEMREAFAELPPDPDFVGELADSDPVYDTWQTNAALGQVEPAQQYKYDELAKPCEDCAAYCCKFLVFPRPIPETVAQLDYLYFAISHPGLEVAVGDKTWGLIVRTECRHLNDGRCAIFGQPSRPLACRYYDELSCRYRGHFGTTRPDDLLRIRAETFPWLVELLHFDVNGALVFAPSTREARRHLELRWRDELRDYVQAETPS